MTSQKLSIQPVATEIFRPHEDLVKFILRHVPTRPAEKSVLAVTSKIVSLSEGRLVPLSSIDKQSLIRQEADTYLGEVGHGCHLTVKHGLLLASAGIDLSNSESGDYLLLPKNPFASAARLWTELKEAWQLSELGILITDSHTTPLRKGVSGIALAHWGFAGTKNLIGAADLFGRPLKMTVVNVADGLAAAATLMMGEGAESQPLCWIQGVQLTFGETTDAKELLISPEEDLYLRIF